MESSLTVDEAEMMKNDALRLHSGKRRLIKTVHPKGSEIPKGCVVYPSAAAAGPDVVRFRSLSRWSSST